jgi:hypothetical protein
MRPILHTWSRYVCRTVAEVVKADKQTDIAAIVYDPDNPFTAEEQA